MCNRNPAITVAKLLDGVFAREAADDGGWLSGWFDNVVPSREWAFLAREKRHLLDSRQQAGARAEV